MPILGWLQSLSAPLEGDEGVSFRAMQLGIMRLIYGLALAIDLILMARDIWQGTGLAWVAELNALVLGAAILASGKSERGRQVFAWVICADWMISVAWAARHWPEPGFPGPLLYLPVFGIMGVVMADMRLSAAAFAGALGILVLQVISLPAGSMQDPWNRAAYSNLFLLILCAYALTLCAWALFTRLVSRLAGQNGQLKVAALTREAMLSALFDGLTVPLERLRRLVAKKASGPAALKASLADLNGVVERTRRVLQGAGEPKRGAGDPLAEFRLQVIRWSSRVSLLIMVCLALRVLVLKSPALPVMLPMLASFGLVVLIAELRPDWQLTAAGLQIGLIVVSVFGAGGYWPPQRPWPGLPFLSLVPYLAVILSGFSLAGWISLACLVALGALTWFQAPLWGASGLRLAVDLALLNVCTLICWYLMGRLMSALVGRVRERSEELGRAGQMQARLCATLFHDVANPLHAMGLIAESAATQGSVPAADWECLARLEARLTGLVEAARRMVSVNGPAPDFMRKNIEIAPLLAETRELFSGLLAEKGIRLEFQPSPGLACRAVPELLRDSVLSNLVSNAIKFSPRGASIEVRVAGGDVIEIRVRDQGAGPDERVLRALAEGGRVPSSDGTEGEPGQGYGLTLAVEYAARMGASISLERAEGGGCEAVLVLEKAQP